MDANIWGFILQVLIAVGGVFAAVYVIKKDILDLKNDISHLKKDMELIKKDVGKVEGIEEYIKNLSCYFNDNKVPVPERLKQYESKLSRYYQSNSPVKLTEKGENVVKFQNSWGASWGENGFGYIEMGKFNYYALEM